MENTKKGFTLIELLVVIAIIGILSAIGLVTLSGARGKARDVRRVSDLRQYALAMISFYDSNGNSYDFPAADEAACQPSVAAGVITAKLASTCSRLGDFFKTGGNGPNDPDSARTGVCTSTVVAGECCTNAKDYSITDAIAGEYSISTQLETGSGGFGKGGIRASELGLFGSTTPIASGGCQ